MAKRLNRLVAAAGCLLACAAIACVSAGRGDTRREVDELRFPGFVRAFAFDSGRVAWIDGFFALRTRALATGAETRVPYTNQYEEGADYIGIPPSIRLKLEHLVLVHTRLLWRSHRGQSGGAQYGEHVYLATVGDRKGHRTASYGNDTYQGGFITGIAGDTSGFSYSLLEVVPSTPDGSPPYSVDGGLFTLAAGRWRRVPDVAASFLLGRADGRVALATVDATGVERGTRRPRPSDTVEIRDASTGVVVSSFSPGPVRAGALSGTVAVVLAGGRFERRTVAGLAHFPVLADGLILRYDVTSGRLLGSTPAPRGTAPELAMDGNRVVLRTQSKIVTLDARTGRLSTVASTSPWQPGGVAIDGKTVAWAESRRTAPGPPSKKTFETRIRTRTLAS